MSSGERLGGGKKPALVPGLRQHDAHRTIRSCAYRLFEKIRPQLRRAVVIGIEQNENAALRAGLARGQLEHSMQLASSCDSLASHANRTRDFRRLRRESGLRNPSKQHRNGGDLAVAFNDGGDPGQYAMAGQETAPRILSAAADLSGNSWFLRISSPGE